MALHVTLREGLQAPPDGLEGLRGLEGEGVSLLGEGPDASLERDEALGREEEEGPEREEDEERRRARAHRPPPFHLYMSTHGMSLSS